MFDHLSLVYTFITGMIIITTFDIKISLTPDGNWNGRVHYCYIHIIYIYTHPFIIVSIIILDKYSLYYCYPWKDDVHTNTSIQKDDFPYIQSMLYPYYC